MPNNPVHSPSPPRTTRAAGRTPEGRNVSQRLERVDWDEVGRGLFETGYVCVAGVLRARECRALISMYANNRYFRTRVEMDRLRFGSGAYAYFRDPLPPVVAELRRELYRRLRPLAAEMLAQLGLPSDLPPRHAGYRRLCRAAGQPKPTPLLLRYGPGGYNRLHRDLYGPLAFPLQATILLSRPGNDFTGGEFLLVENRPREQAIATAITLERGEMVIFPVRWRPVEGRRGISRGEVRHGLSRVHAGERYALGIILHDAA